MFAGFIATIGWDKVVFDSSTAIYLGYEFDYEGGEASKITFLFEF
jgi:hypothetical protein